MSKNGFFFFNNPRTRYIISKKKKKKERDSAGITFAEGAFRQERVLSLKHYLIISKTSTTRRINLSSAKKNYIFVCFCFVAVAIIPLCVHCIYKTTRIE